VKALEVCQSIVSPSFDIYDNIYDINQNVMPSAGMSVAPTNGSTALLAPPTNGGTAPVSLAFNNHINTLIGQVVCEIITELYSTTYAVSQRSYIDNFVNSKQIFKIPYIGTFCRKFVTNLSLKIPLHLKRIATLPCKIYISWCTTF